MKLPIHAPSQPYFLTATLVFLGTGYWLVHRASKRACVDWEACVQPLKGETGNGALYSHTCKFFSSRDADQSRLFPPSVAISRRRARASRDMTVPIGTSVV